MNEPVKYLDEALKLFIDIGNLIVKYVNDLLAFLGIADLEPKKDAE